MKTVKFVIIMVAFSLCVRYMFHVKHEMKLWEARQCREIEVMMEAAYGKFELQ